MYLSDLRCWQECTVAFLNDVTADSSVIVCFEIRFLKFKVFFIISQISRPTVCVAMSRVATSHVDSEARN